MKGSVPPRRRRPTLAAEWQAFLVNRPPDSPVFTMPPPDAVVKMLRADLADARSVWIDEAPDDKERDRRETNSFLAYRDQAGRYADFHALRHTFVTNLARGGVHPKQVQDPARHSDINLTMSRYSPTLVADRAAAVEALPDLTTRPDRERKRATGTDGKSLVSGLVSGLAERRTSKGSPLSSDGTETEPDPNDRTRLNPSECSASDRSGHRMTRSVIEVDDKWRGG